MHTDDQIQRRLVWNRMAYVSNRVATGVVLALGLAMILIVVWTVGHQVAFAIENQVWLSGSFAEAFGLELRPLLAGVDSLALREALIWLGSDLHVVVPCGIAFLFFGLMHFLLADGVRRIQIRWAELNFDLAYKPVDRDRLRHTV